ncbi:hypothetical protein [Thauera sp. Sel9]|uniref:hypothetical protein n=1 Tax=Thauera sp. Sel9 TaxID=2974299 RepID=UPI0021E18A6C|nr:hypothetical protein [Thauera sp. Sel9]MCV2219863.1 hypothetical protein [Thauera sp. Sel9]
MKINSFYLLDRNSVNLIKESINGKIQKDKTKLKFIKRLRSIDRKGNFISPLFSIIEGEKGRKDSFEEKISCLNHEADVIRQFYKHARVDSDFLSANAQQAGQIFTENLELGWPVRTKYFEVACPMLKAGVPKLQRSSVQDRLLKAAKDLDLPIRDPLVVICLACLHGGKEARGMLKPASPRSYNALSDLYVIIRIGFLKALMSKHGPTIRIHFLSMDTALAGILSMISYPDSSITERGDLNLSLKYEVELFKDLSKDEAIDLLESLLATTGQEGEV